MKQFKIPLLICIPLFTMLLISPVFAADVYYSPFLQTNKESLVAGGTDQFNNGVLSGEKFSVVICGQSGNETIYDLYIDDVTAKGLNPPLPSSPEGQGKYSMIASDHYQVSSHGQCQLIEFTTTKETTPYKYNFRVVMASGSVPETSKIVEVLAPSTPTSTPTPTPTPTTASPTTSLTTSPTYVTTTTKLPTTLQTTILPTTSPTSTVPTQTITIVTSRPTTTINYSATIEALQKQVDDQNAKIEEQGNWLDQILRFLGLK